MTYKIISDSSCDLRGGKIGEGNILFTTVPLSVFVNGTEFVDTPDLDVSKMLKSMSEYNGKSTSSCPSPQSYLNELSGADKYFVVTISSKLSGSYNSALVAKNSFSSPDDVCVIDSKSASGALVLIIDKLAGLIGKGEAFEAIQAEIADYVDKQIGTTFVLDKFDNFIKNGRISPMKAAIAKSLSVKPICEADNGEIKFSQKVIGLHRAFKVLVQNIANRVKLAVAKTCVISYCECKETAEKLKADLLEKCRFLKVKIVEMKGLCSFYALEKGIIVSYEM